MSGATTTRTATAIGRGGGWVLRNRWLMRAPIWIYRARLGFVFGSRMLMLEHVGRKTGARRYVVLEVLGRTTPGTYVVTSGFGDRAQWYRNVQANPHVRVAIAGHGPSPATARLLSKAESGDVLAGYIRRHRAAWRRFKPVLENTLGTGIDEQNTQLPMIALRLEDGRA